MAKGLPGYPSANQMRAEALALARSAVPTRRSINRQYGGQISNAENFTTALAHLLQQGDAGSGYDSAVTQQQGVDAAAQARLQALGGQYGAGSAAAVGGMGDSALSSLIARGAAADAYQRQIPAVGAARGQAVRQGLVRDQNNALQQRSEDLRSAYSQAIQQVQQNALARSTALANLQNQRFNQQLATQQLALQQASLGERAREFNASQAQQAAQFQANLRTQLLGGGGGKSGGGALSGFTPNEVSGLQNRATKALTDGLVNQFNIGDSINRLVASGIPRPIALFSAMNVYSMLQPPSKQEFTASDGTFNGSGYRNATKAFNAIAANYKTWISTRGYRKQARKWQKEHPGWVTTPPGYQH